METRGGEGEGVDTKLSRWSSVSLSPPVFSLIAGRDGGNILEP